MVAFSEGSAEQNRRFAGCPRDSERVQLARWKERNVQAGRPTSNARLKLSASKHGVRRGQEAHAADAGAVGVAVGGRRRDVADERGRDVGDGGHRDHGDEGEVSFVGLVVRVVRGLVAVGGETRRSQHGGRRRRRRAPRGRRGRGRSRRRSRRRRRVDGGSARAFVDASGACSDAKGPEAVDDEGARVGEVDAGGARGVSAVFGDLRTRVEESVPENHDAHRGPDPQPRPKVLQENPNRRQAPPRAPAAEESAA
mmetsp:Transcript_26741/g.82106  ORF Transcript_26741/g.82106 Transcript_26741/m.82106 type:complete len:254 (+) Transcript_26741:37-798(+)